MSCTCIAVLALTEFDVLSYPDRVTLTFMMAFSKVKLFKKGKTGIFFFCLFKNPAGIEVKLKFAETVSILKKTPNVGS